MKHTKHRTMSTEYEDRDKSSVSTSAVNVNIEKLLKDEDIILD
jgi:hypothetical protein